MKITLKTGSHVVILKYLGGGEESVVKYILFLQRSCIPFSAAMSGGSQPSVTTATGQSNSLASVVPALHVSIYTCAHYNFKILKISLIKRGKEVKSVRKALVLMYRN